VPLEQRVLKVYLAHKEFKGQLVLKDLLGLLDLKD
jgi:hypothetical protein